MAVAVLNC